MKVGVIGAGASGLMASYVAAKSGHQVTLFEHTNKAGKKILATGGGKCNLSNDDMSLYHFHGDLEFVEAILNKVGRNEIFKIFDEMGLIIGKRNGYYYPYNEQALTVSKLLITACGNAGVNIVYDCKLTGIIAVGSKDNENEDYHLTVSTDAGAYIFDKVILCAGSKASPGTGSDGSGYALAAKLGHSIVKPLPALCALKCRETFFKNLAGIRCKASIRLYNNKSCMGCDSGELQLTSYGISGIPVMQLSYLASKALDAGYEVSAHINFLNDKDESFALSFVNSRIENMPDVLSGDILLGTVNEKLIPVLLKLADIKADKPAARLLKEEKAKLCRMLTDFTVSVYDTNSFEDAQVCCGGVSVDEVYPTLESKLVKGLYFAGEILDVNGDCGGYNLQWAFSTGALAGGYLDA